jgi:YidC/Oxa1 family membrane protein insertase
LDRNFLLAFGLSLLVITLWMSLQPAPERTAGAPAGSGQVQAPEAEGTEATPPKTAPVPAPLPIPGWEPAAPGGEAAPFEKPEAAAEASPAGGTAARTVTVTTDLFEAELSSLGGTIARWDLRTYHDQSGGEKHPVSLAAHAPGLPGAMATPFGELGLGNWAAEDFTVEQPDRHTVVFSRSHGGVVLRKTYLFEESRYDFRVRLELTNGTGRVLEPIYEAIWPAVKLDTSDFAEFSLVALQDEDIEQLMLARTGGTGCGGLGGGGGEPKTFAGGVRWAGAQTRYFLAALIPEVAAVSSARFLPQEPGKVAIATVGQNKIQLGPGASNTYEYRVYVGPKEPARLAAGELGAAGLEASVQLGYRWVAPLTRFFTWLLAEIYHYVPNYGWVIILVTILVRLVTAPLLGRQMRSMKKMSSQMQALKPRLDAIKEAHGDDRQRMSEETMKAYREAGVNPLGMLGGCLPLLLQFPVFIGLFYALQSSIELRQAPFIGWITDLSVPETLLVIPGLDLPLRVLPLIMGGSMFLQQKLTPQTSMDPAQAQMMMTVMPVMFTVLFYQFPSGLVLYWMVSNFLAIAHQLWINRAPA